MTHADNACKKIEHVMPANLSFDQCMDELQLFIMLCGMHQGDPLYHQLIGQSSITLNDTHMSFLHLDQDDTTAAAVKSANAAITGCCYVCHQLRHVAKDCPHTSVINKLIAKCNAPMSRHNNNNNNNNNNNRHNNTSAGTGGSSTSNTTLIPSTQRTNAVNISKAAGVATSSLCTILPTADWLCDSGATSTMTGNHSVFMSLRSDQQAIRIANGDVIYSEGLGPVCFLSKSGFYMTIKDVLFMPTLALSLFASNHFAHEQCDDYMEILEFPMCRWVNRHTGATEFTAMI